MKGSIVTSATRFGVCVLLVWIGITLAAGGVANAQEASVPQQAQEPAAAQDVEKVRSYGFRGALSFLSEDSIGTGLGFSGIAVLNLILDGCSRLFQTLKPNVLVWHFESRQNNSIILIIARKMVT